MGGDGDVYVIDDLDEIRKVIMSRSFAFDWTQVVALFGSGHIAYAYAPYMLLPSQPRTMLSLHVQHSRQQQLERRHLERPQLNLHPLLSHLHLPHYILE